MPEEIKTPPVVTPDKPKPTPTLDNMPIIGPSGKANIDRWLLIYDGIVTPALMENLIMYGFIYTGVLDVKIAMDLKNNTIVYTLFVTSKLYKKCLKYDKALNKYANSKSLWGKFRLLKLLKQSSDLNIRFNIQRCVNDYLPPVKLSDGTTQSFKVVVNFVVQPYLLSKLLKWLGIK